MGLLNFFKRQPPELLMIEQSDININKEIMDLITRAEGHISELKNVLSQKDISLKDAKLSQLENVFVHIKTKIDSLLTDVKRIISIETQNRDFIILNDDSYLQDKSERLQQMAESVDYLLELMAQRPAVDDLRSGALSTIDDKMNLLITSINNIVNDDKQLSSTYEKIEQL